MVSATDGPAGKMTGALVAPMTFHPSTSAPTHWIMQWATVSTHSEAMRVPAQICAIGPHTDHPWSPQSHGLRIPEGGVPLIGEATG